jgi:hypothetical protein
MRLPKTRTAGTLKQTLRSPLSPRVLNRQREALRIKTLAAISLFGLLLLLAVPAAAGRRRIVIAVRIASMTAGPWILRRRTAVRCAG